VARATEIDVFQYLDYRAFLRDWYAAVNRAGRTFSYRAFARRAALKSPNYLKLVIDGERNLSRAMAERFGRACGLDEEPLGYFIDLVAFNQAGTQLERNQGYARLTSFRKYRQAHKLDLAHAAYHSAWFIPAIRELAAIRGFREDPEWIGQQLTPPISTAEARRALDVLFELGMLKREGTRVVQSDTLVSTGPETRGLHITSFHKAMAERAIASIDLVAAEERDISGLTLNVGEDGLRRIKARLQRFRRELLDLSALEDDPRRVIQVNFQLFPLSSEVKEPREAR
jgi:uncharacterized protein (TIGR02147 family)